MSQTMRAARYHGIEDIRIETIPRVPIKPGYIRIAPAYVGICGTDLHEYMGGPTFSPVKPHPVTHEQIPIGVGHEFSGTILEIGSDIPDASKFQIGMKCALQPTIYCGNCGACRNGVENACPNGGFIGLSGGGGGMSEEVLVPASQVFPVSDRIPLDVAALVEPLAVAWHAVDASPLQSTPPENAAVLVMGGGPIGLAVVQCLRALGTKTIIVAEIAKQRQEFANEFGAHHVFDPTKVDIVEKCKELATDGVGGVDIAFDCAGLPVTIKTGCHAIKSRGTFVNVAIWEREIDFNPNWLVFREGKYCAVLGYQSKDYRAVIDLMEQGKIKAHKMITSKITLDDLVEKGIKALLNEKDKHVKILVDLKASGLS